MDITNVDESFGRDRQQAADLEVSTHDLNIEKSASGHRSWQSVVVLGWAVAEFGNYQCNVRPLLT